MITWDVMAVASAVLPTNVSGSAGILLSGGGGGASNDNLSLVAKAKTDDYAGGNGSKSSVELGWGGGSSGTSSYSLDLAGDFATNAAGELVTTVTQDEFDVNAASSSNGNDWFRAKHDAKSNVVRSIGSCNLKRRCGFPRSLHLASSDWAQVLEGELSAVSVDSREPGLEEQADFEEDLVGSAATNHSWCLSSIRSRASR